VRCLEPVISFPCGPGACFNRAMPSRPTASSPPGSCGGRWRRSPAYLAPVYPGHAGWGVGLLSAAFGRARFVYLRCDDVVAQAVSRLRPEQTGVWFETADERQEAVAPLPA
jgi:LPS sulfotransferase NodH